MQKGYLHGFGQKQFCLSDPDQFMHLSMLSRWGVGRPGIGGGFDTSHCPVVGTFDRFNGLSSNILLTFSCYFDNPQMPRGGAFEKRGEEQNREEGKSMEEGEKET